MLAAVALAHGSVLDAGFATVGLGVSLVPWMVEWTRDRPISGVIHLAAAALPLVETTGRALDLYEQQPIAYDLFAHAVEMGAVAAIVLVLVGSGGMLARLPLRPLTATALGGLTGVVVGIGWEVVEAAVDPLFSGRLQHGFDDTTTDILAGTLGAIVASVLVVLYWRATGGTRELSP